LDGSDHGVSGHIHFLRRYDDVLQSRSNVALPLGVQSQGVRVPVDACAVRKPKLFRNGRWGAPADEGGFNFFALFIAADRTIPLMPSEACRCLAPGRIDSGRITG